MREQQLLVLLFNMFVILNIINNEIDKEEEDDMNILLFYYSNFFFNSPVSKNPRPKTDGYWIDVFPNLTDNSNTKNNFKAHFRITRSTFNLLLFHLQNHPSYNNNRNINIEIQVAIAIWRLANNTPYRIFEQTLGISQGSVANYTDRFLKAMLDQFSNIISWPNESQIDEISYGFESVSSFNSSLKKVIGAIDGSHIRILPTIKDSERYINRKGYHSINLMGVVDHTEKFTYVYIGEPGSVHDARVFRRSSLFHEIQANKQRYL
jgi:hypothetical protein